MIEIVKQAAWQAGEVLLNNFRKNLQVAHKTSSRDIVTEADIASQKKITTIIGSLIKKKYPQFSYGFIGEENLHFDNKEADYLFVIDPLDGTVNFASGFEYFAVSIGVFFRQKLIAGVIYLPTAKTFYFAEYGQGAYKEKDNQKIKLSVLGGRLSDGLIAGYCSSDLQIQKRQNLVYRRLRPHIRSLRILVAAAVDFCLMAENVFLAAIYGHGKLWDLAAGQLILEEAGGKVTDLSGKPLILADFLYGREPIEYHAGYYPALRQIVKILS